MSMVSRSARSAALGGDVGIFDKLGHGVLAFQRGGAGDELHHGLVHGVVQQRAHKGAVDRKRSINPPLFSQGNQWLNRWHEPSTATRLRTLPPYAPQAST